MFRLQHKSAPCLWYDHQAGEAAAPYISLFGNARVVQAMMKMVKFDIATLQRACDGA